MDTKKASVPKGENRTVRYLIIAAAAVVLFAASYAFASGSSGSTASSLVALGTAGAGGSLAQAGGTGAGGSGSGSPACACCGGGGSSEPVEGTATLDGSVQRIDVDLSTGSYNPNVIVLKAGVPAEITFGESGGCTAQVMSKDLAFFEDLTSGPRTVKVAALEPGEYEFSCGMQMVFGKVVVQ